MAVGAGVAARSIALVGFGLDSLIDIFAAVVVIWNSRAWAKTGNAAPCG